ncbi:GTPase Der [Tetrabaena socialis]|uniref:GTPase Der n=1 Tax=Tetrabaena socialis TaxID=47790 RepID=A0A2J8AE48_9CHLO|nr:GTPase Der [Tetrabaena socialis]|eukprot:PNH10798.1 GTPase Der [Tetrabaena socialis]
MASLRAVLRTSPGLAPCAGARESAVAPRPVSPRAAHLRRVGLVPSTTQVPYKDAHENHANSNSNSHSLGPAPAGSSATTHAAVHGTAATTARPGAAPAEQWQPVSSLRPLSGPIASASTRRLALAPLRPLATAAAATSHAPHRRAATVCAAAAPSAAAAPARPSSDGSGSTTAHGIPRIHIGFFGIMNSGKSTLVNALTQHQACIVDPTPGTTADVKTVLLELHALGPTKLLDTAGLDQLGSLGEKKRRKALSTLKECDVAVIVVDTETLARARSLPGYRLEDALGWERRIMAKVAKYGVFPMLLLNVKGTTHAGPAEAEAMLAEVHTALDPERKMPALALDLEATELHERSILCCDFIEAGARLSPRWAKPPPDCLPRWCLGRNAMLLMVDPMGTEMAQDRLRAQAMVQEEAIRHWATVLSVRLDLDAARGKLGPEAREAEREHFNAMLQMLAANQGPSLVVTDSQAVDVVHPWTLDAQSGQPLVPFTTFSIAMAYQQSGGRLEVFVEDHLPPSEPRAGVYPWIELD